MQDVSIDLGTANTVVWDRDRGVLFNEPSTMARRLDSADGGAVVCVGNVAEQMLGRAPDGIEVIRPVRDGVVTDVEATRQFLLGVLAGIAPTWWQRRRLSALIGVPARATALDRRGLLQAAEEAGIGRTRLIPEPVAGAVGCGADPLQRRIHLVVDVGGGTSEVAAFGSAGILAFRSSPLAGDEMTFALYTYLRHQHRLIVGELEAEQAKMRASSDANPALTVAGLDAATGRARVVNLVPDEVAEAVRPVIDEILSALAACLHDLPAQAVSDVVGEGVLTVGGGTLVAGFAKRLADAFGFAPRMAGQPLTRVAEGAARCLANPEALARYAVA